MVEVNTVVMHAHLQYLVIRTNTVSGSIVASLLVGITKLWHLMTPGDDKTPSSKRASWMKEFQATVSLPTLLIIYSWLFN
jgi:hypothetical protein